MYSRIFFLLVIVCAVKASMFTVNVYDDNPETEIASSLKGCNPQECDQRCRRLKFPGGACVNGRCKCDNFLNVKDDVSVEEPAILKDLESLEDDSKAEQAAKNKCRNRVCDAVCRALHNTSGACVDEHCKCTNNTLAAEDIVSDPTESLRSCNPIRCDEQCRRNGHEFGVCFKGQCKCDYFLNSEVDEPEVTSLPKNCNPQECDQRCRRLKFPGGACVNGRCKCDNFFSAGDIVSDPAESLRSCNPIRCDEQCRRNGHGFGVCFKGQCKCDYFLNSKDIVTNSAESLRSCNPIRCDEQCRRNGHEFGVCFKGQCKCDYFLKEEVDAVNEFPQAGSKRYCNLTQCNQTCANRGYDSARCIHGWCKCYSKMERQDASPLNDVTEDENEVSNDILRAVAEELSDVSPRACKSASCNQACRAFYFKGGWCRFGRCQCF